MSAYSKDVCIIHFGERSHLPGVQKKVLHAFREGIMCFQFHFQHQDSRRQVRKFEDRVALPADADEACALEMAEFQFERWLKTLALVVTAQ